MSKHAKVIIIIVVAAAAVILGVFFVQKNFYEEHFFEGTTINGWDCSGMTVKEVKAGLQEQVLNYSLEVLERGGQSEKIEGNKIGLEYVDDGSVDEILESQKAETWFLNFGKTFDYSVASNFVCDNTKLVEQINKLNCLQKDNMQKPQNAYLKFDNTSGFSIVPEEEGTTLAKKTVRPVIEEAVKEQAKSVDLDEAGLYKRPTIFKDDKELNAKLEEYEKWLSSNIVYDFSDRQYTVNRPVILDWILEGEDQTYSINYDKTKAWVNNMAFETDTFALERDFTTSTGETIHLAGGGDYGWCMDQDPTAENLYNLVLAGAQETLQPEYIYTAMDRSTNDIGDTYVEVCISSQTLWCYKDGQLIVSTPVITGCEETGFCTPSGSCWAVDGKKEDWTFTHFDNSNCKYWLPFNEEVGIHDATWNSQEAYENPETYKYAGSHGCVNTPLDPMTVIYSNVEIGYPVVVYYSVDQVVGPTPTQQVG